MILTQGAHLVLPNGVTVVVHPGDRAGLLWRLRHPWAEWGVTDAGELVTLCNVKGKPQARPTGWRVADLEADWRAELPIFDGAELSCIDGVLAGELDLSDIPSIDDVLADQ